MRISYRHLNFNFFKIINKSFTDKKLNLKEVSNTQEIREIKNINKIGLSKVEESIVPVSDDKNLPEYFKTYSMKMLDTKSLDFIPHNQMINNELYKYGLPVANKQIQTNDSFLAEKDKNKIETPMMNTMNYFELDKDSSYESLVLKYDEMFKNGKLFMIYRT